VTNTVYNLTSSEENFKDTQDFNKNQLS